MKTRKITALFLVIITLFSLFYTAVPAGAIKYGDVSNVPREYWSLFDKYQAAVDSGNASAITTAGEAVISYWLKGKTSTERAKEWSASPADYAFEINDIWSKTKTLIPLYEKLNDYQSAVKTIKIALEFADLYILLKTAVPDLSTINLQDMEFARTELNSKLAMYNVSLSLYVEHTDAAASPKTYTAINSPKIGAYFGESNPASQGSDKRSAALIYVTFENEDMETRVEYDLKLSPSYTNADYSVIEVAWNLINEGDSLKGVLNQEEKITKAANYLKNLEIPVLLRFGAEMNEWSKHPANAADFIAAFRFVSDIIHKTAKNVAMVWSVNDVSAAGLTYQMFYPGDSYVDWVGISLYTLRYFRGDVNTTDRDAAIYGTGKYANPVEKIKALVDLYGDKKPIMISEGGVTLKMNKTGEDTSAWAKDYIMQLYTYIPMLFPQVKAFFWFNTERPTEPNAYQFSVSASAKQLYSELTGSGYFIKKGKAASTVSYEKVGIVKETASKLTLQTYCPYSFLTEAVTVQYKLNDDVLGTAAEIPYRKTFDLTSKANGSYKLTVAVLSGGKTIESKVYYLNKSGSNITLSNEPITLDIPSDWYTTEIESSKNTSSFTPEQLIPADLQKNYQKDATREQAAQILINLLELATGEKIDTILEKNGKQINANAFPDTTNKNVLAANALGIINGTESGNFAPSSPLQREQISAIINRTAKLLGYNTDGYPEVKFTDTVGRWSHSELRFSVATGILKGKSDTIFNPVGSLSVEQLNITMWRALNYFKTHSPK